MNPTYRGNESLASRLLAPFRAIATLDLRSIPDALASVGTWWRTMEPRRRQRTSIIGGAALLLLISGGVYLALPRFQPDYDDADIDDIFDYTLLSDEFNNLPVEERLKLLGKLVSRLKNMGSGDSMLLASFAAGIAGSAREQIERNASRLAIDLWDKHAKDYGSVPADEREKFLEQAFVDFSRTMEAVGGEIRDVSDADRINEVRKQAQRDREAMGDGNNAPPPQALGRMFEFMNNNIGSHANPEQKTRGLQMMRDMTRTFRGQDIATGKPKGPG